MSSEEDEEPVSLVVVSPVVVVPVEPEPTPVLVPVPVPAPVVLVEEVEEPALDLFRIRGMPPSKLMRSFPVVTVVVWLPSNEEKTVPSERTFARFAGTVNSKLVLALSLVTATRSDSPRR